MPGAAPEVALPHRGPPYGHLSPSVILSGESGLTQQSRYKGLSGPEAPLDGASLPQSNEGSPGRTLLLDGSM